MAVCRSDADSKSLEKWPVHPSETKISKALSADLRKRGFALSAPQLCTPTCRRQVLSMITPSIASVINMNNVSTKKNLLLTGAPSSGKTTVIKKVIQALTIPSNGLYLRKNGGRMAARIGFVLHALDGKRDTWRIRTSPPNIISAALG